MSVENRSRHLGLLGTVIEVSSIAKNERAHDLAAAAAIAEVERLQRILNVFDDQSALQRWHRGAPPPPEVIEVLELAETWRVRKRPAERDDEHHGGPLSTGEVLERAGRVWLDLLLNGR
jgi:thiamine biosynthesis lipoprotein ApbE